MPLTNEDKAHLLKLVPWEAGLGVIAIALLAVFSGAGIGLYMVFIALGMLIGTVILELDKFLAPILSTDRYFFHNFRTVLLVFALGLFVITSSGSLLGKGMVLAMAMHAALSVTAQREHRVALGLVGVLLLLFWF